MPGVFVNYRTGDGEWAAALVKRELSDRFGREHVFYASQSIRLGEDYSQEILGRLQRCEVLLALIGRRWVDAVDREGVRRLDKPEDWVRREISEAFELGLRVIPVLLDGVSLLRTDELPDSLARLVRCQYLRLHHRSDSRDLVRLVDELIELVPALATSPATPPAALASSAERGQYSEVRRLDPPHPRAGQLRSVVSELRGRLADPAGQMAVYNLVQATATQALDALDETRYPVTAQYVGDGDLAAALEERLDRYERDLTRLLRLIAVGVCSGDRQHDDLWITVASRLANRRDVPPPAGAQEVWLAAEGYPVLLVVYVIGVAGVAAGREDLVYRLLCQTTARGPAGECTPVMRALALRIVVDPRHAGLLPMWGDAPPHQALSVHLRQVLGAVFFNVLGDREFGCSFEDYEYVRSLLELHDRPFSSLGEFAVRLSKGDTTVAQRNAARLSANSVLLRSGAFGGDPDQAAAAVRELSRSAHTRYDWESRW